jgi:hypothetical protein
MIEAFFNQVAANRVSALEDYYDLTAEMLLISRRQYKGQGLTTNGIHLDYVWDK